MSRLQPQHLDSLLMPCRCRRMWKGWVWRTGAGGGGGGRRLRKLEHRRAGAQTRVPEHQKTCHFNGCATVNITPLDGPGDRRVEHTSRVRNPQYEAEPVQPQHTPLPFSLTHTHARTHTLRARRRRRTHFCIQMWNTK